MTLDPGYAEHGYPSLFRLEGVDVSSVMLLEGSSASSREKGD